ncbi:MAG: hypothetical protein V3V25_07900 [Paracoccaceae bacterium]
MKTLTLISAVFGMVMATTPVLAANMLCSFTTECFDTEACQGTNYAFTLENADGQVGIKIVTETETILMNSIPTSGTNIYTGLTSPSAVGTNAASYLLTVVGGAAAIYSTHNFQGNYSITYKGKCEVSN